MAMNFPANPEDGDIYEGYQYDSTIGAWITPSPESVDKAYVDAGLAAKIPFVEKAQPLGVSSLDGYGQVDMLQLAHIVDDAAESLNTLGKLAGQFISHTTEEWAEITSVLPANSVNLEILIDGTVKIKIGDGGRTWQQLNYLVDSIEFSNEIQNIDDRMDNFESLKADLSGSTFTGEVVFTEPVLFSGTGVNGVNNTELSYLEGVGSNIQDQLDDKISIDSANDTLAPKDSPTFSGTVTLPFDTSIGTVTNSEILALSGVSTSESIQIQIDNIETDIDTVNSNLDLKAPLESPSFTGTVSGITSSMVGLGNVDNTADADKPISTATQDALDLKAELEDLDLKANLSGATFTGPVVLSGDPTQALQAVTKQYVDSVEAGLITRPAVKAATTVNLAGTYTNGTAGVDSQLNLGQLATLDIDGVTTWSQYNGILVKNQTNAFENGRYVVLQIGNDTDTDWILKRCPLCDEADEIPGSYIFVTDGAVNEQTGWVQHVDDPATFVVGTDDIDVYQFAGAGSVTAGTNILVDGNQVSVVDSPVFSDVIDASAAGIEFSDGVQTKVGVPSASTFIYKTESYTLDELSLADNIIEVDSTSATTVTIPLDSSVNYPVGTSIDILQTNTGQVTIAATGGVTMNGTPGFKLRTRWSSATILKRASNSWLVYGDLTA